MGSETLAGEGELVATRGGGAGEGVLVATRGGGREKGSW